MDSSFRALLLVLVSSLTISLLTVIVYLRCQKRPYHPIHFYTRASLLDRLALGWKRVVCLLWLLCSLLFVSSFFFGSFFVFILKSFNIEDLYELYRCTKRSFRLLKN